MEHLLNCILTRRSIRKYRDCQIPKNLIQNLLQAAMSAPSACNEQPWHFIVIEERDILNRLSAIHSGFQVLKESPLAILVCGEPEAAVLNFYWEQDCSAATENILIAAQACNLGAVWLGINPRGGEDSETIVKILDIPEHIKPFSLVSIGYPAQTLEPSNRFNENKVHYHSNW